MNLLDQIKIGISTFFNAVPFIFKNKLGWFFIFPVLLSILLFAGGWFLVSELTDVTVQYVESYVTDSTLPDWIKSFITGFIWIFFKIMFFLVFAYLGGFITLIFLSPILAYLSEKVEEIITGVKYPFNAQQLMRDIYRGVLIATRNMFIELGYLIVLFIFSFIPLIGFLSPVIMFFISAYFYGFSFIDYSNERNKLSIKESTAFVKRNKGVATMNGALFSFFMSIPFVGMMFAGFAAIISTVGATLAVQEIRAKETIQK